MRNYIVSIPSMSTEEATQNVAFMKARVVEGNTNILKGEAFPASLGIENLIGDPNVSLSDSICEKLFDLDVLKRTPCLNDAGVQQTFEKKPCWSYSWGGLLHQNLVSIIGHPGRVELLEEMAWDLRYHRNFVHLSVVDDTPQKVLDEAEEEEYDSSSNDESTAETEESNER